jgi:hypothetical protein
MKRLLYFLIPIFIHGCIGEDVIDDYVEPQFKITNPIDTIRIGQVYSLKTRYLNNVGEMLTPGITWESDAPDIISVNDEGKITSLSTGQARITGTLDVDDALMVDLQITSTEMPVGLDPMDEPDDPMEGMERSGTIVSTSSYKLEGDFLVSTISGGIQIDISENFVATTALPGLYIYLTNNPTTNAGAYEIGPVTVFSGAHSYQIVNAGIDITTYDYLLYYCKPFVVKVGDGKIN